MQKALPNSPQTRYFEGNIALLGKDLDKARDIGNELLAVAPDNPRVLQLAGATAYERQEFPQAELHLARALQFEPRLDASRRLLALTYLRTSQPGRALTTLQPLLEVAEPSAQTYSLVAQAQLQAGDLAEAETNFAKAAKLNPKDTRSKAALAVSRLVQGDTGGVAELQSLAAADAGTAADLPLISALVRKKDFAGAMRAIDALEKKLQGPQPGVWNLRARVNLRQGDRASARKNLEKALEIRPDFYPAAAALAGLDLADKRVDDAKKRFDSVLAADPRNVQALLASAALKARTGAPRDDVLATFRDAIKQSPNAAAPRLALINYHFSLNETGAALSAAQQGAAAMPNHPEMVDALGRAQVATNDLNQALSTYNKLVQLQPGSAQALVRVAEVYARSGKRSEALSQLKRALAVDAEYLPAQLALSNAHLEDRKFDDALRIARDVQKQRPNQTIGWLTEGNIQAAQKRWDPALASYRAGLKLAPNSTELASRIHASLSAAGRRDEAEKWAEKWTSDHANDAAFRFYLGDVALVRNDRADAEAQYRHVLRLQPDNALALNNVAWLMAMNDKKGALELAERANKNLPNRPVIMDTLALALVREGQAPKAVEVLRQALSIEPDNAPLRLNLAKALIQINEKEAARGELKELIKLGSKFARQDEVRELLKSL